MFQGCKLSLQHALGSRIPNAVLNVVFKLTYSRKGAKKVKAHGLGVHSAEEVLEFGKQDLRVLEETLGDKQFFFGDKPSNVSNFERSMPISQSSSGRRVGAKDLCMHRLQLDTYNDNNDFFVQCSWISLHLHT